jgi:DNA polymerase
MGEGDTDGSVMLVGEQPVDREDIEGHPFVGPAGRVRDQGLERAGIARHEVYTTNAVKHFRYKLQGKRRIDQKPDRWQVAACFPWLQAELAVVRPCGAGVPRRYRRAAAARLAHPDRTRPRPPDRRPRSPSG